jgi:hypothetical protein
MTDLAQAYVEARRDYLRHISRKRADHETTIFLMQECREARDRYLDTRRPSNPTYSARPPKRLWPTLP